MSHNWPYQWGVAAFMWLTVSTAFAQTSPIVNGGGFPITIGSTSIGSNSTTTTIAGLTLTTPVIGAATGTSLALGGCTIGGNALCTTGTTSHAGNVTISGANLSLSGNFSSAAWTTAGVKYANVAATITDTSSSGTVATAYTNLFPGDTIAASSATTYTNYYGTFFKVPVAGTNVTMTNKAALGADTLSIGGGSIGADLSYFLSTTGNNSMHIDNTGTGRALLLNSAQTDTHEVFAIFNNNLGTEIFKVLANGAVTIAGGTGGFTSNGTITLSGVTTGTNADVACFAAGNVMTLQAAASCTISSLRFKNLKPWLETSSAASLDGVARLHNIAFTMKDGGYTNPDPNFYNLQDGLSAENVAEVFPQCAVYENDMKTPKSWIEKCLIAELVGAIKEQQNEIRSLR